MRPTVPIALILVALTVLADSAEAQPTEPGLREKFANFQNKLQALADSLANKTRSAFQELQPSELSEKTRNWFSEQFQKLQDKFKKKFPRDRSD